MGSTAAGGPRVTIASGQTVSNAIDLGEMALAGIQTPAALTSTTLTFQGSADNSTFVAVTKIDGTAYSITVAASKYIAINPYDLVGIRFLKVVGGSAEGADRVISLIARAI